MGERLPDPTRMTGALAILEVLPEVSFKGLLSSRGSSAMRSLRGEAASALSDGERLAMLNELERSGLGWFWASDAEGKLTYISTAIAERLDVPLGDLLGQPLATIFTAADREGRAKSLPLMLGAHKAFTGMAVRSARKPDGPVLRLAGQPVFSGNARFAGFRGTGADIPTNSSARRKPRGWRAMIRSPASATATAWRT